MENTSESNDALLSIAVVVPCYNYGRYLSECLNSILAQSVMPGRVIVIDDASNDSTFEIAQDYAAAYASLEVRRNPIRMGLSSVRNMGAEMTHSEFLCFIDADDTIPENYLDECLKALCDSRAGYAYPSAHYTGSEHGFAIAQAFDRPLLYRRNFVLSSALIRRGTIDTIGGWSTALERLGVEDWQFWFKALHAGIDGVPAASTWLNYRRHVSGGASVSGTSARHYLASRHALRTSMGSEGTRILPWKYAIVALLRIGAPELFRRIKRRVIKPLEGFLCPVPGCRE